MPFLLESAEFLPSDLPLVGNFCCGVDSWSLAMNQWIKAPPTAAFGVGDRDTVAWLYFAPDGSVVGFGSLGTTRRSDPFPQGKRRTFSIIPAVAIDTAFQRLGTTGNDCIRLSNQILADLIGKAMAGNSTDHLILGVHKDNAPARKLYGHHFGFVECPGPSGPDGNQICMTMRLR
jgi:hypothetical protein